MSPGILRRADRLRDLVKSMAAQGRPLAATAFPLASSSPCTAWQAMHWPFRNTSIPVAASEPGSGITASACSLRSQVA